MIILGIDPGTATTGYGVIEDRRGQLRAIEYGSFSTSKHHPLPKRLKEIYDDFSVVIKKHKPKLIAVESVFFYNNVKTAISVSESRGVILLCAQQHKIQITEYTPLQVKSSLAGYGKADKKQIQYMVKALLNLESVPKPDDAADALAIAICAAGRKF